MSYVHSKLVTKVARAIVDVQMAEEHLSCKEPALCMARAAIREVREWDKKLIKGGNKK